MSHSSAQSGLLTQPVVPLILRIALPGMAGMLASSLAALFDALLLGRQSPQLLAAVSLCFPLLTIIQTIGFTLGMGAGSFVSRSLGRGDSPAASRTASTALYLALLLCLLLGVPGFVFAEPMMRLLGAQGDALAPAAAYARCVLLAAPLLCANLVLSSLLRAQGKAVSNMLSFVLGAAVSLGIQLCFLGRLSLFIAGAAMLARESVTLLILLFSLLREKVLIRPRLSTFSLRLFVLRDIMQSGLPTLLRQGLVSVSSAMLMRTAAAFGEAALSGMGLAVRVLSVVSSAIIGFSQGFQPVCGAAFGAGQMDRVQEGYRFCRRCVHCSLAALGALLFFAAKPLLSSLKTQTAAASFAAAVLRAQSISFFAQGAVILMNILTQAMGLTVRASVIACSRQGYVLILLLMILPRLLGETGLVICQSVSDLLSLPLCAFLARGALTGSSCARGGCSDARKASQSDRRS